MAIALEKLKAIFQAIISHLDLVAQIVGGIAAVVAVLIFVLPDSVASRIEGYIASMNGEVGWAYYEVGKNRALTSHGNFHLIKDTPTAFYEEINVGDKLRVHGDVNMRSGPSATETKIFILANGDCAIVIEKPNHKVDVTQAESGGWLQVATASCQ